MKNVLLIAATLLLVSCGSAETNTETTDVETVPSIGFNTMLPDLKFHLGTEDAIKVVKDLDAAWAAKDYEKVKTFFSDTAVCYFEDGKVAKSPDEFVAVLMEEDEMFSEISWTFDYAYSMDLDPTRGGEHVQAGFTGTALKDGVKEKKRYHESYYVIDGKISIWSQFSMDILKEEKE